ncbi:MAG: methyltransferase [Candidatus Methanomethyliaceae archaeon]|nr:methyltransferase [Candidatus Methanomethyliaceae archaeon]MDW7970459.1 methyltransferase [Nitrososphaerota archaeon]
MKRVKIRDRTILIYPEVYEPAEDSLMLVDAASSIAFGDHLDLCCGTGIVGLFTADKVNSVTAIDINPNAIKNTKENFKINGFYEKLNVIIGDLFTPLKNVKFDIITINPPYLWDEEPKDVSWNGGVEGRKIIDRFIKEVGNFLNDDGKALLVQSTLNDVNKTLSLINRMGLYGRVLMEQRFMFEGIVVIEVTK